MYDLTYIVNYSYGIEHANAIACQTNVFSILMTGSYFRELENRGTPEYEFSYELDLFQLIDIPRFIDLKSPIVSRCQRIKLRRIKDEK